MRARQNRKPMEPFSQRRQSGAVSSRPTARASRQRSEPLSAREKRRLAQLMICAMTFVILVAIKLLLPTQMAKWSDSVSAWMGQNIDVTSVFSAVGRAVSGEESVQSSMDDVYQEVFHPQGKTVETAANAPMKAGELGPLPALRAFGGDAPSGDNWLGAFCQGTYKMKGAITTVPTASAAALAAGADASGQAASSPAQGTGAGTAVQTSQLSYILYSNQNLPANVSLEQSVLGFDYCTPVCGTLSSDFGYREHPIEGEEKFHYGVDLAADTGTEIDCFADGTVKAVGESSSYGKYVMVSHAGGYSTLYAHCSAVTVSSGAAVKKGQKIAEVGATGLATGPHLHFELHDGDTYLDPLYYVTPA